ncbi:SGNH/GDSL hydrolase family protein [Muricoccus radiodurans]|uniref:SGNH/GDSL hydrolase family protein n=1 Tax=Muricoccus radiodurans TaxID=2231721 RepID=UPI003CED8CEF
MAARAAFLSLALLAGLTVQAGAVECPPSPAQPLALPRLAEGLRAGAMPLIIALGSSSTQGAGASSPEMAYPAQLEAALRRRGLDVQVLNSGRGGEDVVEMLDRLEADVIALRPAVVIWQVGVNGAMRNHPVDRFRILLRQGVARLQAAGADVVLMDSQRGPWTAQAPSRDAFDRTMAEVARDWGAGFFSRRRMMDAWVAAGAEAEVMLVSDGLHHNDRGYGCLADALAEAIRSGKVTR